MSLSEWVSEHFRTLALLGAGYVAFVEFGGGSYPTLPEWSPLVAGGLVVALIVAGATSGKVESLFPESHGIYLEVVNGYDTEQQPVYELTEDQFEDMDVVNGPLNPLPENKHESYEVFHYDEEQNLAIGTWRKSKPASRIVGQLTVDGALDEIRELRTFLEAEARIGNKLRQELPGVMRELDARRLESQVRMMEHDLAPTFGNEGIDDVLEQTLPEHYLPDRLKAGKLDAHVDAEESDDEEMATDDPAISLEVSGDMLDVENATNGTGGDDE